MSTLWTYGDSYAQVIDYKQKHWINLVAEHFDLENKPHGNAGTSQSYTFLKFYETQKYIQHDDIVIVCITIQYRKWFWEDRPELAVFYGFMDDSKLFLKHTTREERNAIKRYMLYLDKVSGLDEMYLYNFLESLNRMAMIKATKTIVFACFDEEASFIEQVIDEFPYLYIVSKSLLRISQSEIAENINKQNLERTDCRIGHICKSNHAVLANKIIDHIENNTPIDLTRGFKTGFVDHEFLTDPSKHKDELFGTNWTMR